jgi:hypothetical protein
VHHLTDGALVMQAPQVPTSQALTRDDRIVVVQGLQAGAADAIKIGLFGAAGLSLVPFWMALTTSGFRLTAADIIVPLLTAIGVFIARRQTQAQRTSEIMRAAGRRPARSMPLSELPFDVARLLSPPRWRGAVGFLGRLLSQSSKTVETFCQRLACGLLVLPGLAMMVNRSLQQWRDWPVFCVIVLVTAIIIRAQVLAVGASLLRTETNDALFPNRA